MAPFASLGVPMIGYQSDKPYIPVRCSICFRSFTPKRSNQRYCGKRCRKRAEGQVLRPVHVLASDGPRQLLDLSAALADLQAERQALGLRPIEPLPYLTARAAVIEAEEQIRAWQRRLEDRRRALAKLPEPAIAAKRYVLVHGDVLRLPHDVSHLGAVSTLGDLGVVLAGQKVDADGSSGQVQNSTGPITST